MLDSYKSSDDADYCEGRKSSSKNLMEDQVVMFKDFTGTHSGEVEASSESPLSKRIERAKIKRELKVPSFNFIHLFDGCMAFYGHSDVARCQQYFSTCLKGPALVYNNLPVHHGLLRRTNSRADSPPTKKEGK
ncbi:hypothetical protein AgCh_038691 [Apium graveolens]